MTNEQTSEETEPAGKPAIVALVVAIAGILTLGFAAPVGFILALLALRRPPRTMAFLALVISIAGMILGAFILLRGIDQAQTKSVFIDLELRLKDFQDDNGRFPGEDEFEGLYGRPRDAWGGDIRYRLLDDSYELYSMGRDGVAGNDDDIRGGPEPR